MREKKSRENEPPEYLSCYLLQGLHVVLLRECFGQRDEDIDPTFPSLKPALPLQAHKDLVGERPAELELLCHVLAIDGNAALPHERGEHGALSGAQSASYFLTRKDRSY